MLPIRVLRMRNPPSGSFVGPLDGYTANLWSAGWLARVLSSYAGPLIRVRRSSDNAEQDIAYLSDGSIDDVTLLAFCGAGDGFLTKLYDQSGFGNDLAQGTSSRQPKVVAAGAYLGTIRHDGSDDFVQSITNSGTPTAFSLFTRLTNQSAATVKVWIEQNSASPGDAAIMYYAGANTVEANFSQAGNTITRAAQYAVNGAGQVLAARYTRQQAATNDSIALFSAGVRLSQGSTANTGTSTGGFVAAPWTLGARFNGASPNLAAQIDVSGLVIYEAAKSDGDMTAISAALP